MLRFAPRALTPLKKQGTLILIKLSNENHLNLLHFRAFLIYFGETFRPIAIYL
jgi:hypothetical protein